MAVSDCSIVFAPLPKIHNFCNLTGDSYGRLIVIGYAGRCKRNSMWHCRCNCGQVCTASLSNLKSGTTGSCGCLKKELNSERFTTHGHSKHLSVTPEFRTYRTAKQRCRDKNAASYARYGGKGIEFRFNSFEEFFKELGNKPTKRHSLDRIDPHGHYEIGNVRWATISEQANNKGNTVYATVNGVTKGMSQWLVCDSAEYGWARWLMKFKGYSADEAVSMALSRMASRSAH